MLYRRGILPLSGHPPCEQSEPVANAAQPEQSEPVANAAQPEQSEPVANAAQTEQSEPVANAAQLEQSEPVANELNEPVAEQRAAKARSKNKDGGKRKEWKEIGIETVEAKESLREAARRWLAEKKIIHRPLSTTSNNGKACILSKCGQCLNCTRQWCFSFKTLEELLIERCGECTQEKDGGDVCPSRF